MTPSALAAVYTAVDQLYFPGAQPTPPGTLSLTAAIEKIAGLDDVALRNYLHADWFDAMRQSLASIHAHHVSPLEIALSRMTGKDIEVGQWAARDAMRIMSEDIDLPTKLLRYDRDFDVAFGIAFKHTFGREVEVVSYDDLTDRPRETVGL